MPTNDTPGLDDPIFPFIVRHRLEPYIPAVRDWWSHVVDHTFDNTGVFDIDGPPGLCVRFTRTAVRSPIKGVQAFPFVYTGYLQLTNIQGGALKMIERVCHAGLSIEEFTIIEKHNLPSTMQKGQFVAFIPTVVLEEIQFLGQWLYFTHDEMIALCRGIIPESVKQKALLKI
jgi:hypothetical protein